jgi:uncharacterized protein YegL
MPRNLNDALVVPEIEKSSSAVFVGVLGDASGSMDGAKIRILNQAMRESISALKEQAKKHADIPHHLCCIAFDDDARCHIDSKLIDDVVWHEMTAGGGTSTGKAINDLVDALDAAKMPKQCFPPVLVLLSDGGNTDGPAYEDAIDRLNASPYGQKAVRIAIGIGTGYDRNQLEKFSNLECGILEATNSVDLVNYIKYVLTTVVDASINPPSSPDPAKPANAFIPPPPEKGAANDSNIPPEVF